MHKTHNYQLTMNWTGNNGNGTSNYKAYERSYVIKAKDKFEIQGSSDPVFRGDKTKYNPEDMLVVALSSCHLLSYLHQCAIAGVIVTAYSDNAIGSMEETPDGGGHFTEVILNPVVTVKDASMVEKARQLHHKASELCFIASSVNFPVHHHPEIKVETETA